MARPKGISSTTLYGIVMIVNAALFGAMLAFKLIDQNVFLGGVTIGTTAAGGMAAYKAEDAKKSQEQIEELRGVIDELKKQVEEFKNKQ
jgi:hypothetical protein